MNPFIIEKYLCISLLLVTLISCSTNKKSDNSQLITEEKIVSKFPTFLEVGKTYDITTIDGITSRSTIQKFDNLGWIHLDQFGQYIPGTRSFAPRGIWLNINNVITIEELSEQNE